MRNYKPKLAKRTVLLRKIIIFNLISVKVRNSGKLKLSTFRNYSEKNELFSSDQNHTLRVTNNTLK